MSIRIQGDVHDVAILGFALGADIVFELLDPSLAFFPIKIVNYNSLKKPRGDLLCRIEHVSQQHTSTGLADVDRQWFGLFLGLHGGGFALLVGIC